MRENNQAAGTTTVWDYDHAGNITKRSVYDYTTGDVGALIEEVNYVYNDSQWGDLLKAYNGRPITYDAIGNPTNDFTWRYTWQHGRQLASMIRIGQPETWNFTYNADGLRTQKTNGTRTYLYTYLGDQLSQMTVDGHTLYFAYDTNGSPISLTYDGTNYYYVTNLQGDILALLDTTGTEVVKYTYDAWGNILTTTGTLASSVGYYNPLRYRGYVYDTETQLYYLQSRYYNPRIGRFINADGLAATGQSFVGNNMFAYCGNNPVCNKDISGTRHIASETVSTESAYDRFISCNWQKQVVMEKQNPTPIGETSKGKVYLVKDEKEVKTSFQGDVVVLDLRTPKKNTGNPDIRILNSATITDKNIQIEILTLLDQHERIDPTPWERNMNMEDILVEWDAHNHIYQLCANDRCLHVDIDNADEGVSYWGYWGRAISEVRRAISEAFGF